MPRQKQIEITEDITARIEQVTDTTVDPEGIVVFEAAALSTRPLHQPGSIYHEARPSRALLEDMAAALNAGTESVPLHTLHLQGDEIPVGRVFSAAITDEHDGSTTLRAMFYLPLTEKDLVDKINLAILDEVSVGMKPTKALCSKCGFDYFGEDANFTHLWDRTCDNEHTLGEEDTHLKLVGLDKWMELSLVSRGASNKPKILSRTKQLVSEEYYDRMAASGTPPEAFVLFASTPTEIPPMSENNDVQPQSEVPTQLEFDFQAAFAALEAKVDAALSPGAEVAELQSQLSAAQEQIEALQAQETAPTPDPAPVATPPAGGVSASAVTDASTHTGGSARAAAFKTRR